MTFYLMVETNFHSILIVSCGGFSFVYVCLVILRTALGSTRTLFLGQQTDLG